jgi:hypothetical protein
MDQLDHYLAQLNRRHHHESPQLIPADCHEADIDASQERL